MRGWQLRGSPKSLEHNISDKPKLRILQLASQGANCGGLQSFMPKGPQGANRHRVSSIEGLAVASQGHGFDQSAPEYLPRSHGSRDWCGTHHHQIAAIWDAGG